MQVLLSTVETCYSIMIQMECETYCQVVQENQKKNMVSVCHIVVSQDNAQRSGFVRCCCFACLILIRMCLG